MIDHRSYTTQLKVAVKLEPEKKKKKKKTFGPLSSNPVQA